MNFFRKYFFLACTVIFCSANSGDDPVYPFEKWNPETIALANTARNISYLSEEEKGVIFHTNLVRLNPKLYCETYAARYLDSAKLQKNYYVKSLLYDLKKAKPMSTLKPDSMLWILAREHAKDMGKSGRTGHNSSGGKNFEKRQKEIYKDDVCCIGENCDYGFKNPVEIVMHLMIDEGVPGYGHRKNILHEKYTHIGVSIKKHKKWDWNCVMDLKY